MTRAISLTMGGSSSIHSFGHTPIDHVIVTKKVRAVLSGTRLACSGPPVAPKTRNPTLQAVIEKRLWPYVPPVSQFAEEETKMQITTRPQLRVRPLVFLLALVLLSTLTAVRK